MGINTPLLIKRTLQNVTENDVIEIINIMNNNPDITLREACEARIKRNYTRSYVPKNIQI